MGCAFSQTATATQQSTTGSSNQRTHTPKSTGIPTPEIAISSTTPNNNDAGVGTGGEIFYTDDDGEELIFYDAVEEFCSVVSNMSYAPASTMRARGVSILSPNSLMSVEDRSFDSMIVPPAPEESRVVTSDHGTTAATTTAGISVRTIITRDSVLMIKKDLVTHSSGVSGQGYPGDLNASELDACLGFREELKKRDPAFREMVLAYSPVEEEAFALCRFLRAREFDYDKVFQMLERNNAIELWKTAREQDYYKDFENFYGCPVPIFMGLFPFIVSGLAKNGATILYFKSGNMNVDALECVVDLPDLVPAMWYLLHTKGKLSMERETKNHNPETTTVLAERIIIMDMKGMPSALFSSRGIEFMKESAKITACFPETLNRSYLINVPTSFSFVWSIVKVFLEARTLAKIGFFSNPTKANNDMLQFVDSNELLSEYGGTGPTFEEVLAFQQRELGNCSRYIVQHMYVTQKESKFEFNLTKDERVDSMVIYSKADQSTNIILRQGTTNLGEATCVKTGPSSKVHYSVVMAIPDLICGPGAYTVAAIGSAKGNYVVAINIRTV